MPPPSQPQPEDAPGLVQVPPHRVGVPLVVPVLRGELAQWADQQLAGQRHPHLHRSVTVQGVRVDVRDAHAGQGKDTVE